ncbi:MAG: hypothetical protein AB7S70_08390 [Hyphomicrobium sp.]|uniref:hypothetical protein n=1 Tax=Hyphomicrobium sp. TaxID=82 RepID=UPI003D0FA951
MTTLLSGAGTFVLYGIVGYVVYRLWRRSRAQELFGDELQASGDPTRYALAAAVLEGSGFRRRIIDMARHRFRAKAPELGLDLPLVVAACERFEREDRFYDWAILAAALLSAPWVFSLIDPYMAYMLFGEGLPTLSLGGVALLAVVLIAKAVRDVRRVAPFLRDAYDPAQVRQTFLGGEPNPDADFFGAADNVVCYGKRAPFVGLGEQVGGWQVAVELDRPSVTLAASVSTLAAGNSHSGIKPVHIGELLRKVDQSVNMLNMPNLDMRFTLFASGTELAQIPALKPEKMSAPRRQTDGETLGHFWYYTDPRARSYRWYVIRDWNGELVFSYLLRLVQRGQSLSIETARLVLPPIDIKYRKVDTLHHRGALGWLSTLAGAIVRSPLTVLYAVGGVMRQTLEALRLSRPADAEDAKEIVRNQAYNYGARSSVRELIAAKFYHVYFQHIDGAQYFSAIDQRVFNAVTEALSEAGVDVSVLVGQAQVVINGGVNTKVDNSLNIGSISGASNFAVVGGGSTVSNASQLVQRAAGAIGQKVA